MTKAESLREDFSRANSRLLEALDLPRDPIVRDSAIQRFEIAFELCWKYLKAYLEEEHNAACTSPSTCFRAAFAHGIIANDPFWIDLAKLRNYTVHTYDEALADYVYGHLPEAARRFATVLERTGDQASGRI
jgi:nucleotidyltransferase substrate binding protein (TIGR01987 family)